MGFQWSEAGRSQAEILRVRRVGLGSDSLALQEQQGQSQGKRIRGLFPVIEKQQGSADNPVPVNEQIIEADLIGMLQHRRRTDPGLAVTAEFLDHDHVPIGGQHLLKGFLPGRDRKIPVDVHSDDPRLRGKELAHRVRHDRIRQRPAPQGANIILRDADHHDPILVNYRLRSNSQGPVICHQFPGFKVTGAADHQHGEPHQRSDNEARGRRGAQNFLNGVHETKIG